MIPFVKMHGTGNDFVVLDAVAVSLDIDFSSFTIAACNRHFGIGGDGLLLLERSSSSEVRMRMWNPDGTEDMCGNGLRCVAMLAHRRGYVAEEFSVETLAGTRQARVKNDDVRVSMGVPSWDFAQIPMRAETDSPQLYDLPLGDQNFLASSLSIGSTHTVLWRDELPNDEEFFRVSPRLEHHPWFPSRTSLMWAKLANSEIELRIWERGAGETLACGTGACAAAVAAIDTRSAARGPIDVRSKGGILRIEWTDQIYKTGAAQLVYEGTWNL